MTYIGSAKKQDLSENPVLYVDGYSETQKFITGYIHEANGEIENALYDKNSNNEFNLASYGDLSLLKTQ